MSSADKDNCICNQIKMELQLFGWAIYNSIMLLKMLWCYDSK